MNKLQKSKNRMLFGVCGGLADYLGIDTSFVRIGFIVGSFCSFSLLFWIYLIMALILPKQE